MNPQVYIGLAILDQLEKFSIVITLLYQESQMLHALEQWKKLKQLRSKVKMAILSDHGETELNDSRHFGRKQRWRESGIEIS